MFRDYSILLALRAGEVVEIDGALYKMATVTINGQEVEDQITPGDTYVAKRNTDPRILTAERIDLDLNSVIPKENAYPYDIWECVKIVMVREASAADKIALIGPSAAELRSTFAHPFDITNPADRERRRMKFRDAREHRTYEIVVTEGLELDDGTWVIEGYLPGSALRMRFNNYSPENRTGTHETWYVESQPAA